VGGPLSLFFRAARDLLKSSATPPLGCFFFSREYQGARLCRPFPFLSVPLSLFSSYRSCSFFSRNFPSSQPRALRRRHEYLLPSLLFSPRRPETEMNAEAAFPSNLWRPPPLFLTRNGQRFWIRLSASSPFTAREKTMSNQNLLEDLPFFGTRSDISHFDPLGPPFSRPIRGHGSWHSQSFYVFFFSPLTRF